MPDFPKIIRVLLVTDSPAARERVRAALATTPHIEIAAESTDGLDVLDQVRLGGREVVVIDVNLPRLNGMAATARLLRDHPETRILVLTTDTHPEFVVEIIRAGARGCVSVTAPPTELATAIEKVAAGEGHFGLDATVRFLRRYVPAPPCVIAEPIKALTARESEIVACISEGLTNRQIAERLNVAVRTVETHRERVMRKLDLPDRNALRSYATAHGLLAEVAGNAVSTES